MPFIVTVGVVSAEMVVPTVGSKSASVGAPGAVLSTVTGSLVRVVGVLPAASIVFPAASVAELVATEMLTVPSPVQPETVIVRGLVPAPLDARVEHVAVPEAVLTVI